MMNPNIFKKVKHEYNYSFWLIKNLEYTTKRYALLINNDIICMVIINFGTQENPETKIIREIFSFSNEDELKELLMEFRELKKDLFDLKKIYDFLDDLIFGKSNPFNNKDDDKKEKFYFFLLLLYEFINNRELKYSMPKWFRESFLVKALSIKLRYKFINDFLNRAGKFHENEGEAREIYLKWLCFCLDNWRVNLNYPPILENFPENEVIKLLEENKNFLRYALVKPDIKVKILNFFLKRYDIKKTLDYLMASLIIFLELNLNVARYISSLLLSSWFIILLIFVFVPVFFQYLSNSLVIYALFSFPLLVIYTLFLFITHKIFFPRALFGSTVAWTILLSTKEIEEFPGWFCENILGHSTMIVACEGNFIRLAVLIFNLLVAFYIISEIEGFVKGLSLSEKIEKALMLLVFIYSIAFSIGVLFAYKLLFSDSVVDVLKYYYLTSIATFISIAAQIMWEDKPITEV